MPSSLTESLSLFATGAVLQTSGACSSNAPISVPSPSAAFAIAFWLGGFTFYALVVIPVGTQVLGGTVHAVFSNRNWLRWRSSTEAAPWYLADDPTDPYREVDLYVPGYDDVAFDPGLEAVRSLSASKEPAPAPVDATRPASPVLPPRPQPPVPNAPAPIAPPPPPPPPPAR